MRFLTLTLLFVAMVGLHGQPALDPMVKDRLSGLFPDATSFSPKEGTPPHFKAYSGTGSERTLVGYAFYTTDLEPLERGYDGPIQILVGIDLTARVTGILVVRHQEPYGSFSVDTPEFAAQFVQKSIRERFRVGSDIDAVATATISVRSASRAIRNGSRRLAKRFLVAANAR
jgi:transcriptional regulator of nitric oxide reductase